MRLSESNRQVIVATLILTGLCLVGLWYFQFIAGNAQIEGRGKEVEELKGDLQAVNTRINRANQLMANKDALLAMEGKISRIIHRLPTTPEASQFHQILVDIISLTDIVPLKVTEGKHLEREFYIEIPYTVECLARYDDLGEFFNMIEEHPERLMRITGFNVVNDSQHTKNRPSLHYSTIQVTTYSYRPPIVEEAEVVEAAKTP